MSSNRRLRFLAAFIAVFGVLFAQLAVATYACPLPWMDAAPVEQAADTHDCCGKSMVDGEEGICQAHCQQGDQSLEKRSAPSVDPAASPPALLPPPRLTPVDGPPSLELPLLLARRTTPSVAVRNCCLRF